ncbi:hypothetical protein TNCV_4181261 [Trichonephila clavipes]|nr:hypothetical protein TNCV_4181261 [Trichonephila clavipes]
MPNYLLVNDKAFDKVTQGHLCPTQYTRPSSLRCMSRCSTQVQRVGTEWNIDPSTSKSINQWERTLKETGTGISNCSNYETSRNASQILK